MSKKVFWGKEVAPHKYANMTIMVNRKDSGNLSAWNENNEVIYINRKESQNGNVYWEIETYKKNPPANFQQESGRQSDGYNAPSEREQPQHNREPRQEPRYSRDDRPAPMPEPQPVPESSQEEDDDIPF